MHRYIGLSGVRAAAGLGTAGAAASSSRVHCRVDVQPAAVTDAVAESGKPADDAPPSLTPEGWVDAAREAVAAITEDDIADGVHSILQVADPPPSPPRAGAASVRELGSTSDEEEDGLALGLAGGATTPEVMAAADSRLVASAAMRTSFEASLTSLLSNERVRVACSEALATDPAFANLMQTISLQADVDMHSLLPLAARAAARARATDPRAADSPAGDPLDDFFGALADGLVRLGKELKGMGSAVGGFAIQAGYRVHRLLTAPFGVEPHYVAGRDSAPSSSKPRRPSADAPLGSPEFWKDVVTTVAMAVVAIMVAKRLPRARPVM